MIFSFGVRYSVKFNTELDDLYLIDYQTFCHVIGIVRRYRLSLPRLS